LQASQNELLIIGGEDHLTGEANEPMDRWARLEAWGRQRWPAIQDIEYRWSGQVLEPVDALAFIGPNPSGPEGVFIITGDSGMGMTHSAVAALMLPELIEGRPHAWAEVYDPARKPLRTMWEYTKQNLHVAAGYSHWFRPGARADDLVPGEGCIVRRGVKLLAVHRDAAGLLHEHSAVCPHLGCIVQWNGAEKSWDCPCHGSRFDADGTVLNGPAVTDLTTEMAPAESR
jgi:nitrite reductase/ring-hydroxylating ferredoxin subunit